LSAFGFTAAESTGTAASCHAHQQPCPPPPPTTTQTPVPIGALLFGDEFNGAVGAKPSTASWGAKQYSSSGSRADWNGLNNVSENGGGDLVITARKESNGRWLTGFLSGKIGYSGARYVEARAKVPC